MEDSKKKYNFWDIVVKIILIVIIIILLLHNCSIVKKLNKKDNNVDRPTGNVDIFEIQCEKDTCKDVLGDKTDKPNTNPVIVPDNNNSNNNKPSTTPDNSNINNNNNNQSGNEGQSSSGNDTTDDELIVKDTVEWKSQNELRIFSNPAYQMESKIAPESSNTYIFIVRNNTNSDVKYNIDFNEENANHINMKYRLKRDNEYIIGSSTTWVGYNELDLNGILLNSKSDHTYYLDWKWFSSDNDTSIGSNPNSKYKLNIEISAESQNE